MSKNLCYNCYYSDRCDCQDVCEDYIDVNECDDCNDIDDMIETNRIAFRAEWFKYIENCNN